MRKSIVTVLAAAAAFTAVPSFAAAPVESEDAPTVAVDYSDLDITSPAGTAALNGRIDAAVDRVCAKPENRDLKALKAWQDCQAEARDSALEQLSLGNPFDHFALASVF